MASVCLTENQVQALLGGALPSAALHQIEGHLDACVKCQLLVSAGVRTKSLRTRGFEEPNSGRVHFAVGDVVAGRYEITRFIARGGMGEVYAANDRMLSEEIALKVLPRPAATSAGALARMKAEVQLARRVTDPHVLRVFDIGSYQSPEAEGHECLFLTMQLLRGETLRERLRRDGPLKPAEVWRLASQLFAALGAAHQIGIVHRDFKSENVMLVPTAGGPPQAVVMDFGLAQVVAADASTSAEEPRLIAGTLGYMAPEQLSGAVVTAAADVFAFGVVLYEMLTGVLPPFRPNIGRNGSVPPPPLLFERLDIPARWNALVRRCLARDPAERFPDIIAARDALARDSQRTRRFSAGAVVVMATIAAAIAWKRASGGASIGDRAVMATTVSPQESRSAAPIAPIERPIPRPDAPGDDRSDPGRKSGRARASRQRFLAQGHVRAVPDVTARIEARLPSVASPADAAPPAPQPTVGEDEAIDPFRESR